MKQKGCACGKTQCKNNDGWNYRFVEDSSLPGTQSFSVYEVYYKAGKIHSWSAESMHPRGDTPADLLSDLLLMTKGWEVPMLRMQYPGTEKEKLVEIKNVNRITGRSKNED